MIDIVINAIDRIYKKADHEFFRNSCKKQIELFKGLKDYIELQGLVLMDMYDNECPSKTWYIRFRDYIKGEFKVSYKTMLQVSKIAPLFYVQHEFSVENKDENSMTPELDGFDGQPYTKGQLELYNKICAILGEKRYRELTYSETTEVVEGLNMPENVTVFGSQVTVESLLFRDVFDICSKE